MDYYLARLPIFRNVPRESLADLDRVFRLQKYRKGGSIFEEGGAADAVYLLRSGLVKAVKYSPKDEPLTMQIIAPGHIFGMMAVMDRRTYPVTAICIHDSEAYRIRAADFSDFLNKYPDFSKAVFSEIGSHVRHGQALRAMAKEPADKRIAFILGLLARILGRELNIRREEIADMAGTTVETAIRVLVRLRKDKMISAGWKKIVVLKPEALETYSARS